MQSSSPAVQYSNNPAFQSYREGYSNLLLNIILIIGQIGINEIAISKLSD